MSIYGCHSLFNRSPCEYLGTHTPSLVFCYPCIGELSCNGICGCKIFKNLSSKINETLQTFNISFESTHNKLQYGTKITSTEVRKIVVIRNVLQFFLIRSLVHLLKYGTLNHNQRNATTIYSFTTNYKNITGHHQPNHKNIYS